MWSTSCRFPHHNPICVSLLPHSVTCPVMEIFIWSSGVQYKSRSFSPCTCLQSAITFRPVKPKYLPQHPILEHHQPVILVFPLFQYLYRASLLFCTRTNKRTIISQIITLLHVSTLSCHPQTACNQYLAKLHEHFAQWPTNVQLFHKLSHCYMFRHYRVILRQPVINTLPSCTSILHNDQQMYNHFTNYHTATCFDTIVSSSDSL
jgi:hypothetical protein